MFGKLLGQPRLTRRWTTNLDDHIISLAWSPDGKAVAAATVGGPIALLDPGTGKSTRTLAGHGFGTTSVNWRQSGGLLASAGQDGKAKIWDVTTGEEKANLAGGAAWVEHVSWHPSLDAFATAAGKKLRLWSADGRLLRDYPDHAATIADLAWRPITNELTSATYGCVSLWSPDADTPTDQLEWKGSVLKLAWAPDGKRLAHGNQDATVHYWIVAEHQELQMAGYPMKVREVCWDPTGTYLATGGGDQLTVWDTTPPGPEDSEPFSGKGHEAPIAALAYQARGPYLASGGQEGKLFLWQPFKAKKFLSQAGLDAGVSQLAWSPNDAGFVVGTESGTVVYFSMG